MSTKVVTSGEDASVGSSLKLFAIKGNKHPKIFANTILKNRPIELVPTAIQTFESQS
jgi:hypothetical protein